MTKITVFCSGTGSNFQAIIDAIGKKKLNAQIALLVCDNPEALALKRAHRNNIPTFLMSPKLFKKHEDYEKIIVRVLKIEKVDLVVLAGFMRILTPYFVRSYKNTIINIHPSLLPNFKGAHAIRDAFRAGVKETGVTVHVVTADVDAGPILAQKKVLISTKDSLESLEKKIHAVEHQLYPEVIATVIASLPAGRQGAERRSNLYAHKDCFATCGGSQ